MSKLVKQRVKETDVAVIAIPVLNVPTFFIVQMNISTESTAWVECVCCEMENAMNVNHDSGLKALRHT